MAESPKPLPQASPFQAPPMIDLLLPAESLPAAGEARVDLATLVADHHAVLYRYAYRLSGSAADSEDLTQEAYLAAQKHLGQLANVECARGWLFTILRNCYLKSCRRRSPPALAMTGLDLGEVPAGEADEPEFDQERLQGALDELPDEFKLVLLMFYFEDCSYKEIAERLDLPLGTVMSRLSRAKSHLKAKFLETAAAPAGSGRKMPDRTIRV